MVWKANLPQQQGQQLVDPFGVAPSTANPNNMKRVLAQRLLQQERFKPRNGQYPHSQGLADLANTGLGLYASHLANKEDKGRENAIAERLIAGMRGGNIAPSQIPQAQVPQPQANPDLGDNTEFDPEDNQYTNNPMVAQPEPKMTSGYQLDPRYEAMTKAGPEGNYNLDLVKQAYMGSMADMKEYRTNERADKQRAEDQIIAERAAQRGLEQQDRQFRLSEQRMSDTEANRDRQWLTTMSKMDKQQATLEAQIGNQDRTAAREVIKMQRTQAKNKRDFRRGITKDFKGQEVYKNFEVLRDARESMKSLLTGNDPIKHKAAMVAFMQALEPEARKVNKSETAEVIASGHDLGEEILLGIRKVFSGKFLLEKDKKALSEAVDVFYNQRKQSFSETHKPMYSSMQEEMAINSEGNSVRMFSNNEIDKAIPDLTKHKQKPWPKFDLSKDPTVAGTINEGDEVLKKGGVNLPLDSIRKSSLIAPTSQNRKIPDDMPDPKTYEYKYYRHPRTNRVYNLNGGQWNEPYVK
jgi:hypothetical protein